MLVYLPPGMLTVADVLGLAESGSVGGWSVSDISRAIISGRWKVFRVPTGVIAVSVGGVGKARKLTIEALNIDGFGWMMRGLRDAMDRLATDWGCHTVETICFDKRLAAAMVKIRAKPVGWLMEWQVEGLSDGH